MATIRNSGISSGSFLEPMLTVSSVDNASYTDNARKFATWVASRTTRCKREKPEMRLEAQMVAERLTAPN